MCAACFEDDVDARPVNLLKRRFLIQFNKKMYFLFKSSSSLYVEN